MILVLGVATVLLVILLVVRERAETVWRLPVKTAASTGFVAIAMAAGALDTWYGRWILVGLALAWVGDVLLALSSRRAFLGGLTAFLLGHVAYVIAFGVRGFRWVVVGVAAGGVALVAMVVWRWLRPHLDAEMVGPVAAYVVVISVMVAMAIGAGGYHGDVRIMVGAGLFYLSDLFVARQRFVTPGYANRLLGLPLYYAGQILLALSVG